MQKITPVGQRLILFQLPKEDSVGEAGIIAMDAMLAKGEIVEVSDELKEIYKVGDILMFPEDAGYSLPHYKKKNCLWLSTNDIWGILTDEKE